MLYCQVLIKENRFNMLNYSKVTNWAIPFISKTKETFVQKVSLSVREGNRVLTFIEAALNVKVEKITKPKCDFRVC